jgi:hypothetical protein
MAEDEDNTFVHSIKGRFFERKRHIEVPESKRLSPDANDIINAVSDSYGIKKRSHRDEC